MTHDSHLVVSELIQNLSDTIKHADVVRFLLRRKATPLKHFSARISLTRKKEVCSVATEHNGRNLHFEPSAVEKHEHVHRDDSLVNRSHAKLVGNSQLVRIVLRRHYDFSVVSTSVPDHGRTVSVRLGLIRRH